MKQTIRSTRAEMHSKRLIEIPYWINRAAPFFDLHPEELAGKDQTRRCAGPRAMVMHYLRWHGYTLKDIGTGFRKDHTTVKDAVKGFTGHLHVYESERELYYQFIKFLNNPQDEPGARTTKGPRNKQGPAANEDAGKFHLNNHRSAHSI